MLVIAQEITGIWLAVRTHGLAPFYRMGAMDRVS